jgi:hypothetical protein
MYVSFDTNRYFYQIVMHMFVYLFVFNSYGWVSVKLYKYICDEVIGSKKVVNCRRQFFNVHDDESLWE